MIWNDPYWRGTRTALMPACIRAVLLGVATLLLLTLVGGSVYFLINTLVVLPAEYHRLANHGVRVEARVSDCSYSKGTVCWLTYS